ncbi:MAG: beta-glucosidase BglX [Candidatus Amulumruptor caecigallinarius]|uniref:Periplasmic beta-glucosidase n=1 Tax=Candidatus Amulumruptor caecigallinarius TaxID=2109911 RepID=A0A4Q0UAL1_9BACT|nr:MAG: beta-glucosidase BglX [Candidatus Amulumruptor caecigallinarius]HJE39078.1 beta-glucosidase BglX [Candidatus Amulumruptor caecigallinarius]
MKLHKIFAASVLLASGLAASAKGTEAEMNAFINDLMGKMTLQEKLGQLNLPASDDIVTGEAKNSNIGEMVSKGEVGGVFNIAGVEKIRDLQRVAVEESRLGIPLLFGMDVIHGYKTVFPIPLALSCSWDMDAIERSARIAAEEASAAGIAWTFSPMVDISRDPRWGRMSEGSGEDPYLGSEIAKAMVKGYQGNLTRNDEILACVKHFALYGASEAGRDYNTVDMSRFRMYNEYFPPYKAAVDAGAASVMTSFNTVDGIPATGNRWLLTDLLRGQWGFDGFVVTDYTAIAEMIEHGMGDLQDVSALALKAGTDMDMVANGFVGTLAKSLEEGKVTMAEIDEAVRRILEAKYRIGLFENPYKYADPSRKNEIYTPEKRAEARRIAAKTFVLLKNEGDILPIQKKGTIAVIGPMGNTRANMPGTWSVAADLNNYKSVYEGIRDAVGDKAKVVYAKGSNLVADPRLEADVTMFGREMRDSRSEEELLAEAMEVAAGADVIIAAMGESSEFSGESSSRSDLRLPDVQKRLMEKLLATGKPVVMLNFSGRPTVMTWESEHVPAILNVWFGGSEAADAIADVVFGDVNPSGRLSATMPRNEGQIPIYYNHFNTGRPLAKDADKFVKFRSNYLDVPVTPLYPFGYGLSYTEFKYGDIALSSDSLKDGETITATVTVTNTGRRKGDEVVQLYIRDLVGSVSRPVKELKGFERITLNPGESRDVTFTITPDMLKFYNFNLEYVNEPGEFDLMIGPNSSDVTTVRFNLK